MKLYNGENIRKVIAANKGRWKTTETADYIIIYPAPELYYRPLNAKAIVFTKQLTAYNNAAQKFPGGCFKAKQYTVTPEKNTLPAKYKKLLQEAQQ